MQWKTVIKRFELGIVFKHGEPTRVLKPGVYGALSAGAPGIGETVEVVNRLQTRFAHDRLDEMLAVPAIREALHVVELATHQRALVWIEGRLAHVLGAGRYAYWREPRDVAVETYDAGELLFTHPRLDAILAHVGVEAQIASFVAEQTHATFLVVNGKVERELPPGRHAHWRFGASVRVLTLDLRERTVEVTGQEIMTADKVTLRVNLIVTYRLHEALKAAQQVADYEQTVYREAQLALRAAVGTRSLDELLGDKEAVSNAVTSALTKRAEEVGVRVISVGLRDIVLPGEMKAILNQVIEAEKKAQAELIRRREETAAARSQANTARLLAENPALARLKELEALQAIFAGANATFVLGQGDLTQQVTSLIASRKPGG